MRVAGGIAAIVFSVAAIVVAAAALANRGEDGIGPLIVVGKDIRSLVGVQMQACVRYRAFGAIEQTCVPVANGTKGDCYLAARIGEPLPPVCSGG